MIHNLRIFVALLLMAAILAGCGPMATALPSAVPPSPTPIPPTKAPTNTPTAPPPTPAATPNPVFDTAALTKAWLDAFDARDPQKIVSLYSLDVKEYDATFAADSYLNFSAIESLYRNDATFSSINFGKASFFVSEDGRFAATIGVLSDIDGSKPDISLLEFKDGKIIWQYDYYGRMPDDPSALQTIPASANQPAPADNIDQTRASLTQWQAAYNSRNVSAFLSAYSDQAKTIHATAAIWDVLSKTDLEKEVLASFTSQDFKSKLDTFFISADGRFAAAQGIYKDAQTADIPMVLILEIENGKIIIQHNYLLLPLLAANVNPISQAEGLLNGLIAAFHAGDADKLVACYSQGVRIYDSTESGISYSFSEADAAFRSNYSNGVLKGDFHVIIDAFFVSDDGRFAAIAGTFYEKDHYGRLAPKPYAGLLKIGEGKIVWEYDYYGVWPSNPFFLPNIPATADQLASSEILIATKTTIDQWKKAYNRRNIPAFLSVYSEQTLYTEFSVPEMRIFQKNTLQQEVTSRFNNTGFKSRLEDSFISADGHFAAVQGIYKDQNTSEIPMVVLLEISGGKIIKQYNYLILG